MFDFLYPIFDSIGEKLLTLDELLNPYYPDHVKWRCKSSRKRIKRHEK